MLPGTILTNSLEISGSGEVLSSTLGQGQELSGGIISYTTWLSGEISALQYTGTFTLMTAPDWYAPQLPREMADVGWTFENLDTTQRYGLNTWADLFGAIVAMPIKLSLNIWELLRFFGPFGLFVVWLLLMAAIVFNIDVLVFLLNALQALWDFAVRVAFILWAAIGWFWRILTWIAEWTWRIGNWVLDWIYRLIDLIGQFLPTGG